jgi:transcriptional regulator with XRE-family HTH domain
MNYAKGLRRAREQAGLSQRKLAQLAGFDASYINHLEAGDRTPSLEGLEKLARGMEVPVGVLLLMCTDKKDVRGIERRDVADLIDRLMALLNEVDN